MILWLTLNPYSRSPRPNTFGTPRTAQGGSAEVQLGCKCLKRQAEGF